MPVRYAIRLFMLHVSSVGDLAPARCRKQLAVHRLRELRRRLRAGRPRAASRASDAVASCAATVSGRTHGKPINADDRAAVG
jgi:hypothetical protein